jgi:hypothetical protein
MIRRILTIFCVIGFVVSVGLWVVSYWGVFAFADPCILTADKGAISCTRFNEPGLALEPGQIPLFFSRKSWSLRERRGTCHLTPGDIHVFGYHDLATIWIPRHQWWSQGGIVLPLWIPTAVFGTLLFFSVRPRLIAAHRSRHNLCINCAYNLEGLTECRCPECGESVVVHV